MKFGVKAGEIVTVTGCFRAVDIADELSWTQNKKQERKERRKRINTHSDTTIIGDTIRDGR